MAGKKAFDPQQVLEKAMDAFWERGYEGISSTVLVLDVGASTTLLTINIRCIWLRSISILPLSERKPALCWSKRERCTRCSNSFFKRSLTPC